MDFFNVVFPLNLGPLTYGCEENLAPYIKPGMIVNAHVRDTLKKGVVTDIADTVPRGSVKLIQGVQGSGPFFSQAMLKLLKWMADYYMASQGMVLKNILPAEAFSMPVSIRNMNKRRSASEIRAATLSSISPSLLNAFRESSGKDAYQGHLLHAATAAHEYSFALEAADGFKNVIVLAPEIAVINAIYPLFQERMGERACLFHSGLSRRQKGSAIERILSGASDIVLGTRHAVFAPLAKVSLIVALHEHSSSYKLERVPFYNARDVAVMRGYLEKAAVLLSSVSPSIESVYNCMTRKYKLLKAPANTNRPKIRITDTKYRASVKPGITKTVLDSSRKEIEKGRKVMFVMNKKGYAGMLHCDDCGYTEKCPDCGIPLVIYKKDHILKCRYCGYSISPLPESCRKCRGFNLLMLGSGTQKVQEDIESLTGLKTVRIDSDTATGEKLLKKLLGSVSGNETSLIIGTKLLTGRLVSPEDFSLAVILNADAFLNFPDFRAAEKAYHEFVSIAGKISPGGELLIQTRMPQNYLYRCLKNYDYSSFIREELNIRRTLSYPPFSRLLLIRFESSHDISGRINDLCKTAFKDVQILGPFTSALKQKSGEFCLLLKSTVRSSLHETAKIFLEAFKKDKKSKIWINVDPVQI